MTEPLDVLVINALMTHLTSPTLGFPVASPSVTYAPVTGTAYLDARNILRAEPDSPSITFNQYTLNRGIFQVDAVVPDGKGEIAGLRMAALVAERFSEGTVVAAGSFRLQFLKPANIASAIKDGSWLRFPVSISYLVIT